eukprot:GILJ01010098.1.p1 GENE.GILJ01010098.1~~GILJ01010098.1.p1  ORF type:complete len:473 (-),score=76.56 GILJ01010098.1:157-1575(-)
MSTFGHLFRVTTFGESHCKGVGAIVDGVPPNLQLTEADIQPQLTRRRPGQSSLSTPRSETDQVTIMSGTERGVTLGTPVALFVPNEDTRPQDYSEMLQVPRPGHADYTYGIKYGVRASSGGGRASARETIGRVAAGAIAEKWLKETYKTQIVCWVSSVGTVDLPEDIALNSAVNPWTREEVDIRGTLRILRDPEVWRKVSEQEIPDKTERIKAQKTVDATAEQRFFEAGEGMAAYMDCDDNIYDKDGNRLSVSRDSISSWITDESVALRCPHAPTAAKMATLIRQVKADNDSTGGVLTCVCTNVPIGLGEPCFDKLQAQLAHAMLSLPATKGFELGSGFAGTRLRGSEHNDPFVQHVNTVSKKLLGLATNNAGGSLGGISTGAPVVFRVAIKPVSTIGRAQSTVTYNGENTVLEAKGRHDPCVLPRAPPLVEGMAALVLADLALIQQSRVGNGLLHTLRDEQDEAEEEEAAF